MTVPIGDLKGKIQCPHGGLGILAKKKLYIFYIYKKIIYEFIMWKKQIITESLGFPSSHF